MDTMNLFALILVGIAAVIGVVLMLIMANFFGVWLRAKIADAPVPFAKSLSACACVFLSGSSLTAISRP